MRVALLSAFAHRAARFKINKPSVLIELGKMAKREVATTEDEQLQKPQAETRRFRAGGRGKIGLRTWHQCRPPTYPCRHWIRAFGGTRSFGTAWPSGGAQLTVELTGSGVWGFSLWGFRALLLAFPVPVRGFLKGFPGSSVQGMMQYLL